MPRPASPRPGPPGHSFPAFRRHPWQTCCTATTPSPRSVPGRTPVRPGPAGPSGCAARLFRTPLGERTAVGFTSTRRLTATLGPGQPWIRLAEPALRALTAPLGVATVTLDPQFTAPAPTPVTTPAAAAVPALRIA
ncbi:hypothetical protein LT493_13985 [Streptomyces tricolor]|nr:hypothetical protein [Streptomyces tricolor]